MSNSIPAANISENETDNAPCLGLLISWQQPWKEVRVSRTRNNKHTTTQNHRHVYISILARFKVLPDMTTGTRLLAERRVDWEPRNISRKLSTHISKAYAQNNGIHSALVLRPFYPFFASTPNANVRHFLIYTLTFSV